MSDLKEFLDKEQKSGIINVNKLGLFFWERGGKQFVKNHLDDSVLYLKSLAKSLQIVLIDERGSEYRYLESKDAQDFLDCLACLGEEKVKELIEELEGVEK